MPARRRLTSNAMNWRLFLILAIYLILAVAYSIVVPIGRGADEWAHYWYAQFIADNGRLPASPAERETAGYKSDWPPLYHLAAAGLTFWVETDGPPSFKYRADNIRRQLVPAQGPEAILHTEDERFPWQQEILIWHIGRFLSIAFSLATLITTYFIALEFFQKIEHDPLPSKNEKNLQSPISNLQSPISNLQPPISNPQPPTPNPQPPIPPFSILHSSFFILHSPPRRPPRLQSTLYLYRHALQL